MLTGTIRPVNPNSPPVPQSMLPLGLTNAQPQAQAQGIMQVNKPRMLSAVSQAQPQQSVGREEKMASMLNSLKKNDPSRFNQLFLKAKQNSNFRSSMAKGGRVGYADGSQPQISKQQIAMAITMLKKGADMDTISSVTGIPPQMIQAVISKLQQGIQQQAPGGIAGYKTGGRAHYADGTLDPDILTGGDNSQISSEFSNDYIKEQLQKLMEQYNQQKKETYQQAYQEQTYRKMLEEAKKSLLNLMKQSQGTDMGIMGGVNPQTLLPKMLPQLARGGIPEIDYRDKGGYVPPIGKKERADDIPAMLSNNEFVFTANAVRNAGGGDVKHGAKKMYALMKKLEGKV